MAREVLARDLGNRLIGAMQQGKQLPWVLHRGGSHSLSLELPHARVSLSGSGDPQFGFDAKREFGISFSVEAKQSGEFVMALDPRNSASDKALVNELWRTAVAQVQQQQQQVSRKVARDAAINDVNALA